MLAAITYTLNIIWQGYSNLANTICFVRFSPASELPRTFNKLAFERYRHIPFTEQIGHWPSAN